MTMLRRALLAMLLMPACVFAQTTYLGDHAVGATVYFPFSTYDSAGASITVTGLAAGDIEVYKNGSMTQRSSDAGYTLLDTDGIDLDGSTGFHGFSIDTGNNTDTGFWVAGSYIVNVDAITVDSQTVRFNYSFTLGRIEAAVATALATYDPPTNAELEARTLVAANYFDSTSDGVRVTHWNGVALATTNPLPNAAPDAAGGLPISDAGGLDLDAQFGKLGTMPNLGGGASLGQALRDLAGATFDTSTDSNEATRNYVLGPTTAGRTLDVTATGGAGIDWANVENPTTTLALTNTTTNGFTSGALTAMVNAILLGQGIPAPTTIATLASQISFTLTSGSADDNAYNGYGIIIRDASTPAQQALGCVRGYTGSTRTIALLEDPAIFTMAAADNATLLPAYCDSMVGQALLDEALLRCEVNTANFAGDSNDVACILTDPKTGAAVTSDMADGDLAGLELVIISGAQKYESRFIGAATDWDGANNEMRLPLQRALGATLADGVIAIIR